MAAQDRRAGEEAELRRSMLAPGRSALAGLVEVDETEIVCRSKTDPVTGGGGRSHQGKILVVGAVEVEDGGAGPGRIRPSQVPDYSAASLHAFLKTNLAPGATAKTDGWSGYPGAPSVNHDPHVVGNMAVHILRNRRRKRAGDCIARGDAGIVMPKSTSSIRIGISVSTQNLSQKLSMSAKLLLAMYDEQNGDAAFA